MTDITLTGGLSYSNLLKENLEGFSTEMQDFVPITGIKTPQLIRSTPYTGGTFTPTDILSPLLQSGQGYWGESMFDDDTATELEFSDLNEQRALNQWGITLLANGLGKAVITAGTTFLDTTVGALYGIGLGIHNRLDDDPNTTFVQGLWDNDFNKAMTEIQEASEQWLPNYYSQAELNSPWYTNILSANFWGDKVLKNSGFTIGALGAAALTGGIGGLTGSLTLGAIKGVGALAKTMGASMHTLANINKTARVAGQLAAQLTNTAISANGEAAIEAINATKENSKTLYANLENQYLKALLELDPTDPNFNIKVTELLNAKELYRLDIDASLRDVGNSVYGANMAILSISNSLLFGDLLRGGFRRASKLSNIGYTVNGQKSTAREALLGALRGDKIAVTNEVDNGVGLVLKTTALDMLSEGSEEGAQNIASNTAQLLNLARLNETAARYKYSNGDSILGRRINPEATEDLVNYTKAFTKTLSELFGGFEKSGWEEFFLGALTGGAGFISVRNKVLKGEDGKVLRDAQGNEIKKLAPTWSGGFMEARRELNEKYDENQVLVDAVNKKLSDENFTKNLLHTVALMDLNASMAEALLNGDTFEFKNSEMGSLVENVFFYRDTGLIDNFKDLYEGLKTIDDTTLSQIYRATMDDKGDTPLAKEELEKVRQEYLDKAKSNLDKIQIILDCYDYVDEGHRQQSEEFKYELAYEYIKLADTKKRILDIENKYKNRGKDQSIWQKLNRYASTPLETLAEEEKEESYMSEQDVKDINRLRLRQRILSNRISEYEAHPEKLEERIFNLKMAALALQYSKDSAALLKQLLEAKSYEEIDRVMLFADQDIKQELYSTLLREADAETRARVVHWNFSNYTQQAIAKLVEKAELPEDLTRLALRLFALIYQTNNWDNSELIIDSMQDLLKELRTGRSEAVLSKYLSPEDAYTLLGSVQQRLTIADILDLAIRLVRSDEAEFGRWKTTDAIKHSEKTNPVDLGDTDDTSDSYESLNAPSEAGYSDVNIPTEEQKAPEGATQYALEKPTVPFTDTNLKSTKRFNKVLLSKDPEKGKNTLKKYVEAFTAETGGKWDLYDIDNIVDNAMTDLEGRGVNTTVGAVLDAMKHIIKNDSTALTNLDTNVPLYTASRDALNNYNGTSVNSVEEDDNIEAPLVEPLTKASILENNIPLMPLISLQVMSDMLDMLGDEAVSALTLVETLQMVSDIEEVRKLREDNKTIPADLQAIDNLFEKHTPSPTTPETDSSPEVTGNKATTFNAEYNQYFKVEELAKNNLAYNVANTKSVVSLYGSVLNWKKTLFVIDNFLRDLKGLPVRYIVHTDGTLRGLFTAVKYDTLVLKVLKGYESLAWTVDTQEGKFLIIGSIGFTLNDSDKTREEEFGKIWTSLNKEKQNCPTEFFVGSLETKITNIGDGRFIDSIEGNKAPLGTTSLASLLENAPRKYSLSDMMWGIVYGDGVKFVHPKKNPIHTSDSIGPKDVGKVYVYVPSSSGTMYRHEIAPRYYHELDPSSPISRRIDDILQKIVTGKTKVAAMELLSLLLTEDRLFFAYRPDGIYALFTPRTGESTDKTLSMKLSDDPAEALRLIKEDILIKQVNPRVLITLGDLKSKTTLLELSDSGCLNVLSLAIFGTVGANYQVAINPTVKDTAAPVLHVKANQIESINYQVGKDLYTLERGIFWHNEEPVTDPKMLELLTLIAACENEVYPGYELKRTVKMKTTSLPGTYHFIREGPNYRIIYKDEHASYKEITSNKKDLIKIWLELMTQEARERNIKEQAIASNIETTPYNITSSENLGEQLLPDNTLDLFGDASTPTETQDPEEVPYTSGTYREVTSSNASELGPALLPDYDAGIDYDEGEDENEDINAFGTKEESPTETLPLISSRPTDTFRIVDLNSLNTVATELEVKDALNDLTLDELIDIFDGTSVWHFNPETSEWEQALVEWSDESISFNLVTLDNSGMGEATPVELSDIALELVKHYTEVLLGVAINKELAPALVPIPLEAVLPAENNEGLTTNLTETLTNSKENTNTTLLNSVKPLVLSGKYAIFADMINDVKAPYGERLFEALEEELAKTFDDPEDARTSDYLKTLDNLGIDYSNVNSEDSFNELLERIDCKKQ